MKNIHYTIVQLCVCICACVYLCVCTKCFLHGRGSSVQHEEGPIHCHHVEGDITQKWTWGHSERLDQRHAACNDCGYKYTSSCGGEGEMSVVRLTQFSYYDSSKLFYCLYVCERLCAYQIRLPQPAQQCVGWRKLQWRWRCQELHYQEPETSHPQHKHQSRNIFLTKKK